MKISKKWRNWKEYVEFKFYENNIPIILVNKYLFNFLLIFFIVVILVSIVSLIVGTVYLKPYIKILIEYLRTLK